MLPDCMYDYRYERDGGVLRCDYCDDEIDEGSYYFDIDHKIYCFHCIDNSRLVAGVD